MTQPFRDDCPPEYQLVRRAFLVGSAAVVAELASSPYVSADSLNVAVVAPTSKYMEASALLVNHQLNKDVGARLAAAMNAARPGIEQDIDAILAVARKNKAAIVEDFFPDLPEGRVKETALAMISAWYTGVVNDAAGAEVYAFELALMYQPTRDVMTIPSYAISGPNGWNASAPPLTDMPSF